MKDHDIRMALKQTVLLRDVHDPEALVLDELGLKHGSIRIDLAVINGALHGYELKSDCDSLFRLPQQSAAYNSIFDRMTLIVAECHCEKAKNLIPEWWGLKIAALAKCGSIDFMNVREASQNPSPDRHAIAKLLWRQEALMLLEELGAADGVRNRPRAYIYTRLAETVDIDFIRARVCKQLKSRTAWRSDERRK